MSTQNVFVLPWFRRRTEGSPKRIKVLPDLGSVSICQVEFLCLLALAALNAASITSVQKGNNVLNCQYHQRPLPPPWIFPSAARAS
jgi:hypothetical protein